MRPQLTRDSLDGSMPSADSPRDVPTFFESYARAFEQFDASAVAKHFAFPLHILDDEQGTGPTVVSDRAGWISLLQRLIEMYRRLELASARFTLSSSTELAPGLHQVLVKWILCDQTGRQLYDFTAGYTLKRLATGLCITAIVHNERSQSSAVFGSTRGRRVDKRSPKRDVNSADDR